MDEQQKRVLAALYAHWQRRAEAVGPERAGRWHDMQYGMHETLNVLGFRIVASEEVGHYAIEEKAP